MPAITLNVNQIKSALAKQLVSFPFFDSTELNNALNTVAPGGYLVPEYILGSTFTFEGAYQGYAGSSFQLVRVLAGSTNLAQGSVVTWAPAISGTVTAAGSTTSVINVGSMTGFQTWVNNGVGQSLFWVSDATGSIFTMRRVLSATVATATSGSITVAKSPDSLVGNQTAPLDALSAVPTNASPCTVMFPNQVIVFPISGNLNVQPCGIALGTVTATNGNFTIIQKTGIAAVLFDTTTAIVQGAAVQPGVTTAGQATGTLAATAWNGKMIGIGQQAEAASGSARLTPVLLTNMVP